ncbi:MAG TPA: hemerythrin domain-containing protein [Kribbellaceae bacterium]|nr:hemerythrin domain-containing protein [Kribbellaceae bacterium]
MSSTIGTKPDTQDMVIVHRAFRREFRLMPDLVADVADGNVRRAAVLAGHCRDIATGLQHHHETEDDLLWPVLLARRRWTRKPMFTRCAAGRSSSPRPAGPGRSASA